MSESDRAAGGRNAGSGRGGRGGRGGRYRNRRNRSGASQQHKYTSKNTELKYDVFEEGKAENASQFVKSKRAIIEYIRRSDNKEAAAIALHSERIVPETVPPLLL
eukprot:scaffold149954_cov59-Cyclotella_meneghiniana.AAC.1